MELRGLSDSYTNSSPTRLPTCPGQLSGGSLFSQNDRGKLIQIASRRIAIPGISIGSCSEASMADGPSSTSAIHRRSHGRGATDYERVGLRRVTTHLPENPRPVSVSSRGLKPPI